MKLFILQSSPASHHFLPLRSKYPLQHAVPKHLNVCSSLSAVDQYSHPYKTTGKVLLFLYFNLHVFREVTGRQETQYRMSGTIPRNSYFLNFFTNAILISCCCSKVLTLRHILKRFISNQQIMILSYILVTRHSHILGFLCIYF